MYAALLAAATALTIPSPAAALTLKATYFGTSTLAFSDGVSTLMIDGFFSRPWAPAVALSPLSPNTGRISSALIRGQVGKLCGVFVAHAHYDHALDAVTVASRDTDTLLFGSASVLRIARAEGFPSQRTRLISPRGGVFRCGTFEVMALPSPHGPNPRFPGEVSTSFAVPARVGEYRLGDSYAFVIRHPQGVNVVHPSAGVRPGMYREVKADTLFLGVGELAKQTTEEIDRYWRETVLALTPQRVVPIHWDNFTRSLTGPLRQMPRIAEDTTGALEAVRIRAGAKISVHLPAAFEQIDLLPQQ